MNNDTNNNLNGTILGAVNNTTPTNPQPTIDNNVETLDVGVTPQQTPVMDNNLNANTPTYFNEPLNNGTEANIGQTVIEQPVVEPAPQVIEPAQQVVEPTPAYTNPQSIVQSPMPGFENPNVIGTTPPISLEPEKQPQNKKSGNKILFIIIILLVLAGVGFGTYYVLNYTNLLKNNEQVTITPKDIELTLGEELSTNITDYATINGTDSRNCSLNTVDVDVTKVGTYKYTITCGETEKSGNVIIKESDEFNAELKDVYKVKGETLVASEFAKTEDDKITYEFVDEENVKNILNGEVGNYTVKIKVSKGSKTIESEAKLIILEHAIKGYLTCSSNEQNAENVNAKMTVSEKFAIAEDDKNSYGKIAYEIHNFVFSDETEYTSYLATYKTDKKITINNITGETIFDDSKLTITITNEKNNDSLISEYGESNMTNYSTIKSYFSNTLGYKCVYEKANTGA